MKARKTRPASINSYLSTVSPRPRRILQAIRRIVKREVPEASETVSYGIPAFRLKRTFIYFAAFKGHIGIYPPVRGDAALARALAPYRGPKGNLKFPLERPVPYELVARVVRALAS